MVLAAGHELPVTVVVETMVPLKELGVAMLLPVLSPEVATELPVPVPAPVPVLVPGLTTELPVLPVPVPELIMEVPVLVPGLTAPGEVDEDAIVTGEVAEVTVDEPDDPDPWDEESVPVVAELIDDPESVEVLRVEPGVEVFGVEPGVEVLGVEPGVEITTPCVDEEVDAEFDTLLEDADDEAVATYENEVELPTTTARLVIWAKAAPGFEDIVPPVKDDFSVQTPSKYTAPTHCISCVQAATHDEKSGCDVLLRSTPP